MAQADSRAEIRPELIKTSLHHLVIQKKKKGMTVKRRRSRDDRSFTLLEKTWGEILINRRRGIGGSLFLSKTKTFPLFFLVKNMFREGNHLSSWKANDLLIFIRLGINKINCQEYLSISWWKQILWLKNRDQNSCTKPELYLTLSSKSSHPESFF